MTHLSLKNIIKSYNNSYSLNIPELNFPKGCFSAVLGPSGCGKTTLLNLLSGITFPTEGSIFYEGSDITNLPPEKRNFGIVFQNYALFPHYTVFENICYGLKNKGWAKKDIQERVYELIELMEINGLEKHYPEQLSGGQQQRVALARAMASKPSVLLLDEPLSALDAKVRDNLGEELLYLQRKSGFTAVMVTHDQGEALSLADFIVLMKDGKIEQQGSPEDIYTNPKTIFAGSFVGYMNKITLPSLNNNNPVFIRYESVVVNEPSELTISYENTFVAKVQHAAFMGAFVRLHLLLNDFVTRVIADISLSSFGSSMQEGSLVAVTLPKDSWCLLKEEL